MGPALETVLRRGAVFLWHRYDRLDDPNLAGQTKAKFIVILSSSPLDDPLLYVLTTSEKPKHAAHPFPEDVLRIPQGAYPFFPFATLIDVGDAEGLDVGRDEFIALHDQGSVQHCGTLTDEHVAELLRMVAASRRLSRRFKQMI